MAAALCMGKKGYMTNSFNVAMLAAVHPMKGGESFDVQVCYFIEDVCYFIEEGMLLCRGGYATL